MGQGGGALVSADGGPEPDALVALEQIEQRLQLGRDAPRGGAERGEPGEDERQRDPGPGAAATVARQNSSSCSPTRPLSFSSIFTIAHVSRSHYRRSASRSPAFSSGSISSPSSISRCSSTLAVSPSWIFRSAYDSPGTSAGRVRLMLKLPPKSG